jgi:hypothetical protein
MKPDGGSPPDLNSVPHAGHLEDARQVGRLRQRDRATAR